MSEYVSYIFPMKLESRHEARPMAIVSTHVSFLYSELILPEKSMAAVPIYRIIWYNLTLLNAEGLVLKAVKPIDVNGYHTQSELSSKSFSIYCFRSTSSFISATADSDETTWMRPTMVLTGVRSNDRDTHNSLWMPSSLSHLSLTQVSVLSIFSTETGCLGRPS